MRYLAAILFCLVLASCASVQAPAVVVQAGQVRAALENRHGWIPATHDDAYVTTSLDALWQANVDSWRHESGGWDCEDNADAMLLQLRIDASKRGDSFSPAAWMMPARMRDGRRHVVVVALCETPYGAEWKYWDAAAIRQIGREEILKPLTSDYRR